MIAIFTLVGLVLFCGGLYGVYDGWPYLVLERGFTEVIIGAIAATAGLIMLSLAWVLKELKGLRRELAAAEARPAAPVVQEAARPVVAPVAPAVAEAAPSPAISSPLVPAALGVGAAAVALAVADKAQAAAPEQDAPERDLFGGLVADQLAAAPDAEEHLRDEPSEPEPAEALPDMFETEPVPGEAELPVSIAAENHEPREIVAAHVQPLSQDEALAHSDDEAEATAGLKEQAAPEEPLHPEVGEPAREDHPSAGEEAVGRDEFAVLRESLTSELGGLNQPPERIEPSFTREDSFASAEAWMRFPERQEPRFDLTPLAVEAEEPAEPEVPLWPPRTEAQTFDPAAEAVEEVAETRAAEQDGVDHAPDEPTAPEKAIAGAPEAAEAETPGDEGVPAATPEPSASEPASSEEGVVGAYQVGEAHFTIYADGSIRARTPDGEYSFASMDELKVYLASEKSRLGV